MAWLREHLALAVNQSRRCAATSTIRFFLKRCSVVRFGLLAGAYMLHFLPGAQLQAEAPLGYESATGPDGSAWQVMVAMGVVDFPCDRLYS